MRIVLSTFLLGTVAATAPAQSGPVLLTEPNSGVSVMLPEDWSFAASEKGLIAASGDKTGLVVLREIDRKFTEAAFDLETSVERGALRDVELDRVVIMLDRERGALEALVHARGSGLDQQGDRVQFALLLVKVGEEGDLVLGAWKNPRQAKTVSDILDSIHVRNPQAAGGLQLSEPETGAAITIPVGWVTMANRKGLLAASVDRGAMALIFRPRADFAAAVAQATVFLRERVFDDVQVGEFGAVKAVDATLGAELGRVMVASGTATDRVDKKPVEFRVLAVKRSDTDEGALILGAWKSEKHKKQVEALLNSIHFAKPAAKKQ